MKSTKYVSDIIRNEYENWDSDKPILIHASTGSGKTTFILQKLLPYAFENGKVIVYLTNRISLRSQIAKNIPEKYNDTICLCNYQKFAKLNLSITSSLIYDNESLLIDKIKYADYYIFDEAHYFLSDADFNHQIAATITKIKHLKEINSKEWYTNRDLCLQSNQFTWIKEQLSWMGLSWNNENDKLHPSHPDHWITEESGSRFYYQKKFEIFLYNHQGFLKEDEQKELKKCFMDFIKHYLPTLPYINSKGSIQKINECLETFFPEYVVKSINKQCFGKRRNWWYVHKSNS